MTNDLSTMRKALFQIRVYCGVALILELYSYCSLHTINEETCTHPKALSLDTQIEPQRMHGCSDALKSVPKSSRFISEPN